MQTNYEAEQLSIRLRISENDFKEVGTDSLGNVLGYPAGIAGGGVVDHQRLASIIIYENVVHRLTNVNGNICDLDFRQFY